MRFRARVRPAYSLYSVESLLEPMGTADVRKLEIADAQQTREHGRAISVLIIACLLLLVECTVFLRTRARDGHALSSTPRCGRAPC